MSDAETPNPMKPALEAWFEVWKKCVQDVLSQVSGQPNAFELAGETLPAAESDLRYTVTASGAVAGEMSLRIPQGTGMRLARKFIGEAEPASGEATPETLSDDNREALEELLRQITGLAATAIGGRIGGKVQLQMARAEAPWTWTAESAQVLRTRDEAGTEITLEVAVSPGLAVALAAQAESAARAATAPATVAETSAPSAANPGQPSRPAAAEFDPRTARYNRLLDVGLGVKLRFGSRHMLLRDVLALCSGLVVELDNQLNSPVDLLLDGRVIAKGDVVVIDGKYGLRVTEVLDAPGPAGPAA